MGTSEIAVTAHLVMPDGQPGDAFLQDATESLHDRFEIEHVTPQVVRVPFAAGCFDSSAAQAAPSAGSLTYRPRNAARA